MRQLLVALAAQNIPPREAIVALATQNHKCIILAVHRPRTRRNLFEFYETPVAGIFIPETKVVANCRRNVQSSALVEIRARTLVPKDILPVIRTKRTTILPLSVADTVTVPNTKPAAL